MKNLLIIPILAILFFTACEDDENTSIDAQNYYQDYELEYRANIDKTIARAYFKNKNQSGSIIPLKDEGQVVVNNTPLTRDSESLAIYYTAFDGFVDTCYYEYTDKNGNIYANEFYLSQVNEIGFPQDTIGPFDMTTDYDIEWEGAPISRNETVLLQIGYEGNSIVNKKLEEGGATSIRLESQDLQEVGKREAQIVISRIKEQRLGESNEAGGRMQLIYSSGLKPVIIE